MGLALASRGSAADFKSRQSSPLPAPPSLATRRHVAVAAALRACDHRTLLTPVATDRTTMPNPSQPWLTRIDTIDPTYYIPGLAMGRRRDRGHTNIRKRLPIHKGGFNLGCTVAEKIGVVTRAGFYERTSSRCPAAIQVWS